MEADLGANVKIRIKRLGLDEMNRNFSSTERMQKIPYILRSSDTPKKQSLSEECFCDKSATKLPVVRPKFSTALENNTKGVQKFDRRDYRSRLRNVFETSNMSKKTISCRFCNMKFSSTCQLQLHMCSHAHQKPSICTFCSIPMQFSNLGKFKLHLQDHHGGIHLNCEYCNKWFKDIVNLKKHWHI